MSVILNILWVLYLVLSGASFLAVITAIVCVARGCVITIGREDDD